MISLPPGVTLEKQALAEGGWSFDFRHRTLGTLGRIVLLELPGGGGTHISACTAERNRKAA